MLRTHALKFLVLWSLATSSTPARSESHVFTLDAQASTAVFVVDSTLHDVHGTLFYRSGELRFDSESGAASGEIVVDATRTDTGNAKRDKKMHGKVLESARYPTFVFEPDLVLGRVSDDGKAEIELRGRMTVHGVSHEMAIPVTVEIEDGRVAARTTLSVPYVEWGLNDPSVFLLRVAKVVDVTLEIRGSLAPSPPDPSDAP